MKFTDEARKAMSALGFSFSWDLVCEVAYKATRSNHREHAVICADGDVYLTNCDPKDIIVALGTY